MNASSDALLSHLVSIFHTNEGLIAALALCIGPTLLLTLLGFIMRSAGASRRPLWVIAGLIAPIAVVFVIAELVRTRDPSAVSDPAAGLDLRDGRFVDRAKLFGPDVPSELIREAKSGLPGILDDAEAAEAGVTLNGETILVAQFPDEPSAKRAAAAYHQAFQLRAVSGDETNGWCATRGLQGDYLEMLRTGRHLFIWTGLTKEACAARRAATDIGENFSMLIPAPRPPLLPALQGLGSFLAPTWVKVFGLLLMVVLYSVVFFKGAAWAGSSSPVVGKAAISARELATRLLSINDLDVPFTITQGARHEEFIADWRYADA